MNEIDPGVITQRFEANDLGRKSNDGFLSLLEAKSVLMEWGIFHDSKLNPHPGGMQVFNRTITGHALDKNRTRKIPKADIRLNVWDLVK